MSRQQKMLIYGKFFLVMILVAVIISALPIVMRAQESTRNAPAVNRPESVNLTYKVEHKHGIGSGNGELHITDEGIEYRGYSENEAKHSHLWRDDDIKRLELSKAVLHLI